MFRPEEIIRENIRLMKGYSSARDEFTGQKGIFLDANENPYGTLNRYPDPHQAKLKEALSTLRGIDSGRIFIGNGSDEVIDILFRIFCEPGKESAVTLAPSYGMYRVSAAINNIDLISVELNNDFSINQEKVADALSVSNVKLLFICSPNNPTGNSFDRNILEEIISGFKGVVVLDEAYIDFSPGKSWIEDLDQYPNLVICQTFSKSYGLAAARVGIAYASEEIISVMDRVKPPYNVSSLNQDAAIKALSNQEGFRDSIKEILEQKEILRRELSGIELVKHIYPSDANFFLVRFGNADKVYNYLVERGIITRNRTSEVKNCIRITVGAPAENRALINALKSL